MLSVFKIIRTLSIQEPWVIFLHLYRHFYHDTIDSGRSIKPHLRTDPCWNGSYVVITSIFNPLRRNCLCLHSFCVIKPFWDARTLNPSHGVAPAACASSLHNQARISILNKSSLPLVRFISCMYNSTTFQTTGIMTPQTICKENTDWQDCTLQAYIKQCVSLSALLRNKASESPCYLLQPFQTLWKIILQKVQGAHAREELEASSIWVFLKQLCIIAHPVKI